MIDCHRLTCYDLIICIEFLPGCQFYFGPNSLDCYVSVWYDVGCLPNGLAHPTRLSMKQLVQYDTTNLRSVLSQPDKLLHFFVMFIEKYCKLWNTINMGRK